MKRIPLTQGKFALVDDNDFDELNQVKWYANKIGNTYYALRYVSFVNGKQRLDFMHQALIGKREGLQIDHIDGNGLNNQRNNLRFVTIRQNAQNRKNTIKTSKFPGVCWEKERRRWKATITIDGTQKHLGRFTNERNAFEAYREAVQSIGEAVVAL